MNIYIETLQQLFDTLPAIADSEGMIQHKQAQADIRKAYEHLDKAVTRLVVECV